ncbi:MAG: PilW family protein [Roseateles sp.]|uniref:PilW family protein n=1 Tax=Roseateles sp. TaxID=1971397 RepID=UPI0040361C17
MLNSIHRRNQRGLSLVELMVGITIGLIVAAGASMVAVNQINEHRRLMLEVQVQQDLRTAADILQQDIRRAGYRGFAQYAVWQPASGVGTPFEVPARAASASPYASAVRSDTTYSRELSYSYSRVAKNFKDTPFDNEQFGIKWNKGNNVLYLKLGVANGVDNWQPITDPESVKIIGFDIDITSQASDLNGFCDNPCAGAACPPPPQQIVRRVSFTIRGQANHDPNIIRTLSGVERIRADALTGACPP